MQFQGSWNCSDSLKGWSPVYTLRLTDTNKPKRTTATNPQSSSTALFGFLFSRCNENLTSISLITTTGTVSRWPNGALIRRWWLMGQYWVENRPASLSWVLAAEHTAPLARCIHFVRPERRSVTLRHMQEEGMESVEKHSCGLGQLELRPNTGAGVVWVCTRLTPGGDSLDQCKGFQGEEKDAQELAKVSLWAETSGSTQQTLDSLLFQGWVRGVWGCCCCCCCC